MEADGSASPGGIVVRGGWTLNVWRLDPALRQTDTRMKKVYCAMFLAALLGLGGCNVVEGDPGGTGNLTAAPSENTEKPKVEPAPVKDPLIKDAAKANMAYSPDTK